MSGYSDLALGLYTCILRFYYHSSQTYILVYISQVSGERLQDHWSSGLDHKREHAILVEESKT